MLTIILKYYDNKVKVGNIKVIFPLSSEKSRDETESLCI